jgi:hypothetical protein
MLYKDTTSAIQDNNWLIFYVYFVFLVKRKNEKNIQGMKESL